MAIDPPGDLVLTPLRGRSRPVSQMLTTFHLLFVALDPFTNESAWILPTATRVLHSFEEADCRVALLVTATPEECRLFLGPYASEYLTFADPDREAVKAFGLERLPAIVHLGIDGTVVGAHEGWHPMGWRQVTEKLADIMGWLPPNLPVPADPEPFDGTPAAGA